MIFYAVDDEPLQLKMLTRAITDAEPNCELHSFTYAEELLTAMDEGCSAPEVAFLDIELPDMGGLELAYHIKKRAPKTNIVFVTGFSQYAQEAYALRPSGYVMKPVSKENIRTELENLRHPPDRTVPNKRIRIQCFGSFEIFVDDVPVSFSRTKSKELLAYLVDRRGTKCTAGKLADILWDDGLYDRSRQKQIAAFRSEMIKSLKKVGAAHIINETNDSIIMDPEQYDCDYYMALAGDTVAINSFNGEYMTDYSWAEFTAAALMSKFGEQ
ncbi:response regulator [Anaerotruncus sp. AF02-27]|uniref:response regulator n=1 Tax=Anaerotruncus TaxID=244127 RepID=UPI000E4E0592|nr:MULTISPECIES: response regulator [Anaerotruncus]RGX56640.1 response regulator [Anaerotruncus sp. AF02-27]